MSAKLVLSVSLVVFGIGSGCAVRTRPTSLADAAAAASSDRSREAQQLAPTSFAEAEKTRRDADAAYEAGDASGAQILGEQATAQYARAFVHARTARATKSEEDAQKELDAATAELAQLKGQTAGVEAEILALETKIKVAKDAQPVVSSGPADPARERARLDAAKAIATEARLLCVSAKLVAPDAEGLNDAMTALADVEKTLADPASKSAPIDAATRARSLCLASLTKARHTAQKESSVDAADALLGELSKEGTFAPVRDDRGVVITIADAFTGDRLSKSATTKLDLLGKIAAAHATMPVLVVVHDADAVADTKRDQARGDAAKGAIAKLHADHLDMLLAGATKPLVDPKSKDRAKNERLEIVFVSPTG